MFYSDYSSKDSLYLGPFTVNITLFAQYHFKSKKYDWRGQNLLAAQVTSPHDT